MTIAPGQWDFGIVPVGSTSTAEIYIQNTGGTYLESVHVVTEGSAAFSVLHEQRQVAYGEEIILGPQGLAPGDEASFTVVYAPDSVGPEQFELGFVGDCFDSAITLHGRGNGEGPLCIAAPLSNAIWAYPGDIVDLDVSVDGSADGLQFQWLRFDSPTPGTGVPVEYVGDVASAPEPDDINTPRAQVLVEEEGSYRVSLRVLDADGDPVEADEDACDFTRIGGFADINVRPPHGLAFEVSWTVESEDESETQNVDLAILPPTAQGWREGFLACDPHNTRRDWGAPGPEGDCWFISGDARVHDFVERAEIVSPDLVEGGDPYEVGISYTGQAEAVEVTLKIYKDGELLSTQRTQMTRAERFWHAASVQRGGATGWRVDTVDALMPAGPWW